MRRRNVCVICALALLGLLGCGTHSDQAATTTTSTLLPSSSTTAPTTTSTAPAQPVTIVFAGDINFESGMAVRLANDPQTAIGPYTDILTAADIAVGNLETAVGTGGTPERKQFTFEAPPSAIDAMRAAGFDTVSMANNHGRDFGAEGLEESLAIRDAQPDHFIIGIGHNDVDAYSAFTATVRGQRIAVIGATQVIDGELVESWTATATQAGLASAKRLDALVTAVQQARANADTVVVFLHWGVEKDTCPTVDQQNLARTLADAGADIIIGGHAHRLQGAGLLGAAFVGYGLGNFDFNALNAVTSKTGVVRVTVSGRHIDKYEFIPGVVRGAVATPLDADEAPAAIDDWNALRACTNLTP